MSSWCAVLAGRRPNQAWWDFLHLIGRAPNRSQSSASGILECLEHHRHCGRRTKEDGMDILAQWQKLWTPGTPQWVSSSSWVTWITGWTNEGTTIQLWVDLCWLVFSWAGAGAVAQWLFQQRDGCWTLIHLFSNQSLGLFYSCQTTSSSWAY